jgi:DNA-binding response OmpR family regulator
MTDTGLKVDPGGDAPEDHLSGRVVDAERHSVRINGQWRRLPKKRWQIFQLLLARRGRVVPYDFIIEIVWDRDPPESEAALRTQVWMLRADLTGVEPVGASQRYSKYSRRAV